MRHSFPAGRRGCTLFPVLSRQALNHGHTASRQRTRTCAPTLPTAMNQKMRDHLPRELLELFDVPMDPVRTTAHPGQPDTRDTTPAASLVDHADSVQRPPTRIPIPARPTVKDLREILARYPDRKSSIVFSE